MVDVLCKMDPYNKQVLLIIKCLPSDCSYGSSDGSVSSDFIDGSVSSDSSDSSDGSVPCDCSVSSDSSDSSDRQ